MRRKKRILPFVTTWMDSELMLSELSQRRIMSLLRTITDSMDMNLSKLRETVKDREAWCTVVHGVDLATE